MCGEFVTYADSRMIRKAGVHFRNEIVTGVGGKQILLDDPSGNPIELFEPTRPEASLSSAETSDD